MHLFGHTAIVPATSNRGFVGHTDAKPSNVSLLVPGAKCTDGNKNEIDELERLVGENLI